jgi:hypothetical protein
MLGLRPEEMGVAQLLEIGSSERPSLFAHRAAMPPAQARLGLLKDAHATRRICDGICEMEDQAGSAVGRVHPAFRVRAMFLLKAAYFCPPLPKVDGSPIL